MNQIQNVYANNQKFIEPVTFLTLALLAGSNRLIKYFPGTSTKGLLISAGLTSAPILLSDQNNRLISIVIGLALGTILAPYIAKKLTGRADLNMNASFRFVAIEAVISVGMEFLFSLRPALKLKTSEEIRHFLNDYPHLINEKINWGEYKDVSLSHLLCSGKLGTPEESLTLLKKVVEFMDFNQLDESNLWGEIACFKPGTKGSGNNVLKTAVAAASPLLEGSYQKNRDLIELLLDTIRSKSLESRKTLLDARDNFAFDGGHTIPEFLIRQGNEDLALKSIQLGATITNKVFRLAMQSSGTTEYSTNLAKYVLDHFIKHKLKLDRQTHWEAKAALLYVPQGTPLDSLVDFDGGSPVINTELFKYMPKVGELCNKEFGKDHGFMFYGEFSNQYRWNAQPEALRRHFLSNPENQTLFQELQHLFKKILVE